MAAYPWYEKIFAYAKVPREDRIFYLKYAFLAGYAAEEIYKKTGVDPWFLAQLKQIIDLEGELLAAQGKPKQQDAMMRKAKQYGFSDRQLAFYWGLKEKDVRKKRKGLGIKPVYKLVDTCAAEFKAYTPYFYSTYEDEDESNPSRKKKVMILGGGPNRIGQGIEFDYCCVHAVMALKKMGYETIMVNCNPETVSTDYDTSDKLFFEPLTLEDVLNIYENEKPLGVILQLGGQTPLNLAKALKANGVKILGTSVDAIDRAEDRDRFKKLLRKIGLRQPANGIATSIDEAYQIAKEIGYPVVIRPSYVLGGRAMEIAYDQTSLKKFMRQAVEASGEHPVLIDKFLEDATEMDVDLISDGKTAVVGSVMEHIEEDELVFNNFYKALKPEGMLLVSTPSDQGGSDVHHDHDHDDHHDGAQGFIDEHVRDGYGIQDITDKLKRAGFSRSEVYYQYGPPGKIGWKLSMKYPIMMLNTSAMFYIVLPFYYLVTFPFVLILNAMDVANTHKTGTGLVAKAWK